MRRKEGEEGGEMAPSVGDEAENEKKCFVITDAMRWDDTQRIG